MFYLGAGQLCMQSRAVIQRDMGRESCREGAQEIAIGVVYHMIYEA